jgi:glutamate racemase
MIGIFDSGSGGLTVMRRIRDLVPSSDILYYGDIRNAPYGNRSRAELSTLTIRALQFLTEQGAHSIVSACNSVSASLAISLFDTCSVSPDYLIEMVGPTVSAFKGSDMQAVLFATQATIDAGIYQSGFQMIGKEVPCFAIPELAGAIERGEEARIGEIVRAAAEAIDWSGIDVAILACTHYPLAMEAFRASIPERVGIFDPAIAVAERVEARFWPREAGDGKTRFVITKDSEVFRRYVAQLFPGIEARVEVLE